MSRYARSVDASASPTRPRSAPSTPAREDAEWLGRTLGALGHRHADIGVTPEMYEWVAGALITTMAERGGTEWTDEMTAAWTDALGAVAGLMLDAYPAVAD